MDPDWCYEARNPSVTKSREYFELKLSTVLQHTVRNLHFSSKNSTLISRENYRFFGVKKTRENVVVLDFLAVDNFDFTRKIFELFWVKNSWRCCGFGLFGCWQRWFHEKNCQKKNGVKNSWKCWGFVKIEFLDKKLTVRIVWRGNSILFSSNYPDKNGRSVHVKNDLTVKESRVHKQLWLKIRNFGVVVNW